MFKNLINNIIMGTECYLTLRQDFFDLKHDNACLEDELSVAQFNLKIQNEIIQKNKKLARRIVRAINKEDKVLAKKLCNEIVKGENK